MKATTPEQWRELTMRGRGPTVHVVIGRRGAGKSTVASWIVEAWQRLRLVEFQRSGRDPLGAVFAIDPTRKSPAVPNDCSFHADLYDVQALMAWPDDVPTPGLVVVDEADLSIGQRKDRRSPWLEDLVRRGRHVQHGDGRANGTSLVLATQRPALMLYDVWSLADRVSICHLTARRDLERVAELEGVEPLLPLIRAQGGPGVRVVWDAKHGAMRL